MKRTGDDRIQVVGLNTGIDGPTSGDGELRSAIYPMVVLGDS